MLNLLRVGLGVPFTASGPIITDSYDAAIDGSFPLYSGAAQIAGGQTFNGNGGTFNKLEFQLRTQGSPADVSISGYIYTMSGTHGSSGVPNTFQRATATVQSSSLSGSYQWIEFAAAGTALTLTNGVKYVCYVMPDDLGGSWDVSNHVRLGINVGNLGHAGNAVESSDGSNWTANSAVDVPFKVWTV